jgi:hypothetical protein
MKKKKAVGYFATSRNEGPEVLEAFYKSLHETCEKEGLELVTVFHDLNCDDEDLSKESSAAVLFLNFVYDNEEKIDMVIFPKTHEGIDHDLWDFLFDPYDLFGESHVKVLAMSYWLGGNAKIMEYEFEDILADFLPF